MSDDSEFTMTMRAQALAMAREDFQKFRFVRSDGTASAEDVFALAAAYAAFMREGRIPRKRSQSESALAPEDGSHAPE